MLHGIVQNNEAITQGLVDLTARVFVRQSLAERSRKETTQESPVTSPSSQDDVHVPRISVL